ncbi:hypothetical protein [Synechococcus elongatus]|nr:hypothetical protein [Synechococcus elongatus]MBD2588233.1 hypothetical protein [Synechococcus elongatus FACHB-242]MBD2689301.1 hypothetical protein [Synechococcus elongatus FACHB-1061]MBD2707059.1 hypothetical protein [Synechococcus elongatus PCC 7942 = FACHB-805]WKW05948.1 hypothetical protein QY054_01885 [Synechococcus elongatus PCC 7942 = FACHB-805]
MTPSRWGSLIVVAIAVGLAIAFNIDELAALIGATEAKEEVQTPAQ